MRLKNYNLFTSCLWPFVAPPVPSTNLSDGGVEQREVVVVSELSAGWDVLLGEERHPVQPIHLPLLHFAVW